MYIVWRTWPPRMALRMSGSRAHEGPPVSVVSRRAARAIFDRRVALIVTLCRLWYGPGLRRAGFGSSGTASSLQDGTPRPLLE